MAQITVGRWGKNLAVRFPGHIARAAGFTEGERVEIETRGGEIVLRRMIPHFTVEELFRDRSPEEWRAACAGAYDCGPDVAMSVSRNDGADLHSQCRRSDLDRL